MRIENSNMNNLNQVNGKEQNVPKTEISKKENTIKEQPAAIYEKDEKKDVEKKGHTYDATAIAKLKMQTEQNKLKVFDLIRKSLGKQTEAVSFLDLKNITEVPESVRLEAKELISEDGEFGIEKTSQRIVDFAIAISGNDPSKAATLRDAIEKGFKEAEKIFGDELPQISKDTYTRTMEKFDAWANGTNVEEKTEE